MIATPPSNDLAAVVLDFDGVIADSMGLQERIWRKALERVVDQPVPKLERRLVRNLYRGKSGPGMFEGLDLDPEIRSRLRTLKDDLWEAVQKRTCLVPGAADGLRSLADEYPLAVATSSEREYVEGVLEREDLLDLFAVVLTNDDVPNPKPAPDLMLDIARRLDVEASRLLLVGDTGIDLEMARAAGSAFLLMTATPSPVSPSELEAPAVGTWREMVQSLMEQRTASRTA